jgi:hypothetical protein
MKPSTEPSFGSGVSLALALLLLGFILLQFVV